jgi:hypothetical protein
MRQEMRATAIPASFFVANRINSKFFLNLEV